MIYGSDIAKGENRHWRIRVAERLLAEVLREPEGRAAQTVFAHTISGSAEPLIQHIGKNQQDPLIVFLRPTNRLLDYICKDPDDKRKHHDRADLLEISKRIEEALILSATPHLIIDVGFPDDLDPLSPLTQDLRDRKLARSMIVTALIIDYLFDDGIEQAVIDGDCSEEFSQFLRQCSSTTDGLLVVPEFVPAVSFS
jgi:hypothetical protein